MPIVCNKSGRDRSSLDIARSGSPRLRRIAAATPEKRRCMGPSLQEEPKPSQRAA